MVRVAINGFGRIGRMVFRAGMHDPDVEFVAFNDLTDNETLAHLLKYDSVHGKLSQDISFDDHGLLIDGKHIKVFAERDPVNLPWKDLGVDVVVESTGFFRTYDTAHKHIDAGAKRVIISAPAKDDKCATFVMGINEHTFDPEKHFVVSNASCTTGSLAPLMKVINDNFGIESGFFLTVHSYTADQRVVDGPHSDPRRARACAVNIVPTTSGAAIAATKAIPELEGKVTGMAVRVPTPCGSLTEFTCNLKKSATVEEVNKLFKDVANHHLKGILEYSEEPLVSTDIVGDYDSCIFDASFTKVIDGNLLRVLAWYDNEWGYSSRVIDLIKIIGG